MKDVGDLDNDLDVMFPDHDRDEDIIYPDVYKQ